MAFMTATFATLMSGCAVGPDESGTEAAAATDTAASSAEDALAAANAAVLANPVGSGPFCAITLAKLEPGQTESRVVSYACAPSAIQVGCHPAGSTVLLMTWYQDIRFGAPSTQICGSDGPCDSAGYGISNVGAAWNDRISSFKAFNNCNRAVAFTDINFGGASQPYVNAGGVGHTPALSVDWVGAAMNDKISSFLINRQ